MPFLRHPFAVISSRVPHPIYEIRNRSSIRIEIKLGLQEYWVGPETTNIRNGAEGIEDLASAAAAIYPVELQDHMLD
jgi:hypothetical protein